MGESQFTAEFKAKVVLELISGERELEAIASEYKIDSNKLREWKATFLENAATLFEDNKSFKKMEKQEEENTSLLEVIDKLTVERDSLMAKAHEQNKGMFFRRK